MPTIKDVAKEAGVGIATVSYAINNTAPVKEETRKRIFRAIQKLGYQPNRLARGLVKKRTNIIGLSMPNDALKLYLRYVLPDLLAGIEDGVAEMGYSILLCIDRHDKVYMDYCKSGLLDGLLITCPTQELESNYEGLIARNFPFVVIGNATRQCDVNIVDVSNVKIGYDLTQHLILSGRRHIGLLAQKPKGHFYLIDRLQGYKTAMQDHNLVSPKEVYVGEEYAIDVNMGIDMIAQQAELLDGVFVTQYSWAVRLVKALSNKDMTIPAEMGIVTPDEAQAHELNEYGIITFKVPYYDIGLHAAQRLVRLIDNPNEAPERLWVEGTICGSNEDMRKQSYSLKA